MKNVKRRNPGRMLATEVWREKRPTGFPFPPSTVTDADGAGDCYVSMKEIETNVHQVAWRHFKFERWTTVTATVGLLGRDVKILTSWWGHKVWNTERQYVWWREKQIKS